MAKVNCVKTKQIILTNTIDVDGTAVMGQQCTINSENPADITFSDWINDKNLYKENRVAIREELAKFEDECYLEQETLVSKGIETLEEKA